MMANAKRDFLIKKERPSAVGCFRPLPHLIGRNQKSQSCNRSDYKCADLQGDLGLGFPRLTPGWQRGRREAQVCAFAGLKGASLHGYVFLLTGRRKPKPKEQTAPISEKERISSTIP
jgi:hypothetical protein